MGRMLSTLGMGVGIQIEIIVLLQGKMSVLLGGMMSVQLWLEIGLKLGVKGMPRGEKTARSGRGRVMHRATQ